MKHLISCFSLVFLFQGAFGAALKQTVTEKQAQELFVEIAGRNDISFKVPENLCEMRALKVNKIFFDKGIDSSKIVVVSNGDHKIKLKNKYAFGGEVSWNYHVAPTVQVKTGTEISTFVIDPSIFDGPVTLAKFVSVIDPTSLCEQTTAKAVQKYFEKNPGEEPQFGNKPCYMFLAKKYFFSPMWSDLTLIEQLKYNNWNKDLLEQSDADLLSCVETQNERLSFLEKGEPIPAHLKICF